MTEQHPTVAADEHEADTLPGIEPIYDRLMLAVVRDPRIAEVTPEAAGRFMLLALRGLSVRRHFDEQHPEQLDVGEKMAPPEPHREAWLFGFRFVDRKEGA